MIGFIPMILGTLAAILLGDMLVRKSKTPGRGVTRAREGTIGASQDFQLATYFVQFYNTKKLSKRT